MFKAADSQNRWVKEGGLGLEVIMHLEFSSWPWWLTTREQVFSLKDNDAWESTISFSPVVQRGGWLEPELQSAKGDSSKPNSHQHGDDHSLGTLTKTQNMLITIRSTIIRGHYSPWLPLELPAPVPPFYFSPTQLIFLTEKKNCLLVGLGFFFSPPLWLVLFGSESFFPMRWTSDADQS